MTLVHVPVPLEALEQTSHVWLPFVEKYIERSGETLEQVLSPIRTGEVGLHIVWNPDEQKALAVAGVCIVLRGAGRIAVLKWIAGDNRKQWLPLFADFEKYHKEHLGCVAMRAQARRGWVDDLKPLGYRVIRLVVEKEL